MALPFYTAWKTVSPTSPSNYWKESLQALIDEQFENAPNIYTIQKENNLTGLYEDIIVRLEVPYELKQISTKADDFRKIIFKNNSVSTLIGDYYKFNDSYWICTDDSRIETPTNSCIIQRCNNTIAINKNNTFYTVPCIVETTINLYRMQLEENKYLSELNDNIIVRVPNNDITSLMSINDIYKIGRFNYKLTNLSDVVEPGLLVLKLEYSTEQQTLPTYFLTILNGDSIQISQSQLLTINVQVTSNNEIVPSPILLYSTSDETIATINENGLVTILSVGTVIFTVCLASDESVKDSIVVDVVEDVEDEKHNYTAEISGSNSIVKGKSANYICVFKDNGVQMSNISSVFYLTSDDGVSATDLASISSQDSVANSCVVLAGSSLGYVKLWARNDSGTIVSDGFRIQIKNIF